MRVATVDFYFGHESANMISFGSETSFLDYDLIIWDPSRMLTDYKASGESSGYTVFDRVVARQIQADIARRASEVSDFLRYRRLMVIMATPPWTVLLRAVGNELKQLVLPPPIPFHIPTAQAAGDNIEFIGGDLFLDFWRAMNGQLHYTAVLTGDVKNPPFVIQGTDKPLAADLVVENGYLLVLPRTNPRYWDRKSGWAPSGAKYISQIIQIARALRAVPATEEQVEWASDYVLPGYEEIASHLASLQEKLQALRADIALQEERVAASERYKLLFTGTGDALEDQVAEVFRLLRADVAPGDPGRADLILHHRNRAAVVEVKGVAKSAAEKHAAQLEKWRLEYADQHEDLPKGVLVVNAYAQTPLHERTEEPFPDQMLTFSARRGHCLMTGVQLLCAFIDCKDDPQRANDFFDQIFATEGILPAYADWSPYIQHVGG
jgi:hypothetical protein